MSTVTVAEVMTSPGLTAVEDESLASAAARMTEARVGSVVVVEGNRTIGILTERDLLRAAGSGANPATSAVGDWMTREPECVGPDTSADDAWTQLADRGYRHIPVVAGDEFKGIVSMRDLVSLAQLRPAGEPASSVPTGLKGVVAGETKLSDVRGDEGFYHYRQYSATELAEHKSFEEVWHLLFEGDLPTAEELAAFRAEIAAAQALPEGVSDVLERAAATTSPFVGLRTALSHVAGLRDMQPSLDVTGADLRGNAMALSAAVPVIIGALHRLRGGEQPLDPRADLSYAANFLYMLTGEVPDEMRARAIEQYFILAADHGFNASTFTGRVVTSTGSDLGSVVVSALGALSGPLHGGAIHRALEALDAIGSPERAADWVRTAADSGPIMGFGHAVYRTPDPRSEMLRTVAERLGGERVALAVDVKREIEATLAALKPGREPQANIEWFASVVMELCGIPRDMFTSTFAATRVVGWCAHALEQAADNRIIRPSGRYTGPPAPQPVPLAATSRSAD